MMLRVNLEVNAIRAKLIRVLLTSLKEFTPQYHNKNIRTIPTQAM